MNPFQDMQELFLLSLTPARVIQNLSVALLCGILISRFYTWANGRPAHARTLVNALISLAMITAVVIMVIENNLARAFGLVGAMSIIRFRTAIKDVQDIAFIFFSLAVGMAAGVGLSFIAFIGTLFIGTVMVCLAKIQTTAQNRREYLLQFSYDLPENDDAPYLPLFNRYCKHHHLINMKSHGPDMPIDLSFYVHFKNHETSRTFIRELSQMEGVRNANLFFDEVYLA